MELGDAPIMKIVAHALNYNFAKETKNWKVTGQEIEVGSD